MPLDKEKRELHRTEHRTTLELAKRPSQLPPTYHEPFLRNRLFRLVERMPEGEVKEAFQILLQLEEIKGVK